MPITCYEKTNIHRKLDGDIQFIKRFHPASLWSNNVCDSSCTGLMRDSVAPHVRENMSWKDVLKERVRDFYRCSWGNVTTNHEDAYSIVRGISGI